MASILSIAGRRERIFEQKSETSRATAWDAQDCGSHPASITVPRTCSSSSDCLSILVAWSRRTSRASQAETTGNTSSMSSIALGRTFGMVSSLGSAAISWSAERTALMILSAASASLGRPNPSILAPRASTSSAAARASSMDSSMSYCREAVGNSTCMDSSAPVSHMLRAML